VFDIGSSSSRVGFAGEDCPRSVFPTVVGYDPKDEAKRFVGETQVYLWREGVELKSPVVDGLGMFTHIFLFNLSYIA
jgi:actin-related protein